MKLKHRLAIYSILIFSVIIGAVATLTYVAYSRIAKAKEYQSLESKSVLAAIFYLDEDELTITEHEDIRNQLSKKISRSNIAIFNLEGKQVNGQMEPDGYITEGYLKKVYAYKNESFENKEYFYNGIFYKDNQGDFIVVTRESKAVFNDQIQSLFNILVIAFTLGLIFIYFFSNFLGYIAYEPINQVIQQMKKRDTSNFHEPLHLKKSYAEVDTLIKTYNQFIEQIAQSFSVQKNFIDYVSHELRTPITALLGTLEVTKLKERSLSEYQETIRILHQYTEDLEITLDHMMLLSGAKTTIELSDIRFDEVLWQVVENSMLYHQANIHVEMRVTDTALLQLKGNDKLLGLALSNIISNAVKYSDNQVVKLVVDSENDQLCVSVIDQGIGILRSDLTKITSNFYRGENTLNYQGKGIGLSMANIIFKLHQISICIYANEPKGTVVKLLFS